MAGSHGGRAPAQLTPAPPPPHWPPRAPWLCSFHFNGSKQNSTPQRPSVWKVRTCTLLSVTPHLSHARTVPPPRSGESGSYQENVIDRNNQLGIIRSKAPLFPQAPVGCGGVSAGIIWRSAWALQTPLWGCGQAWEPTQTPTAPPGSVEVKVGPSRAKGQPRRQLLRPGVGSRAIFGRCLLQVPLSCPWP